jgi:hypothetical protein
MEGLRRLAEILWYRGYEGREIVVLRVFDSPV